MLAIRHRTAALATLLVLCTMTGAWAQDAAPDPHHPETAGTAETEPSSDPGTSDGPMQPAPESRPGMMPSGMMGQDMMSGTMGNTTQPGMTQAMPMHQMHQLMRKVAFAIADADGDGALSIEEVSAIQQRIFAAVDADQSGTVTPEELQSFLRE